MGENTIDIANSSRRIRAGELEACAANGVTDILEVRIGYDGIVFAIAVDGPDFAFTPEPTGSRRSPPRSSSRRRSWSPTPTPTGPRSTPSLPDQAILAFIPGTNHGTREVFEER